MKKYFSILLVLIFTLLLIGCNEEENSKKYTIKFHTYTEQGIDSIEIDEKQNINLPTPIRFGYNFEGWYPNEQFNEHTKVTSETIVGKNITLYAKWSPIAIQISLDPKMGTLESELIINTFVNEIVILPTPTVSDENYLFDGWYYGEEKVSPLFSTLQTCTLEARYIEKSTLKEKYNVSFELNGGSFYSLDLKESLRNSDFYYVNSFEYYPDSFNQVVANFMMQYNQTINMPFNIDRWFFFDFSYNHAFAGNESSNSNYDFFNNWRWLYQYLAHVGTGKDALTSLYLNNLQDVENVSWSNSLIRAEISAFLNANCFDKHSILTTDYSNDEIRMGYVDLLNLKEYKVGEVTPLLIPIKEGYTFMGWYDNPNFDGLPLFELDSNAYGDKVFYAKWN